MAKQVDNHFDFIEFAEQPESGKLVDDTIRTMTSTLRNRFSSESNKKRTGIFTAYHISWVKNRCFTRETSLIVLSHCRMESCRCEHRCDLL